MKTSNMMQRVKDFWRNPDAKIFIVLFVFLIIGIFTVTHYGQSWDEDSRYKYAQSSVLAYLGENVDLADEKGAFFSVLGLLGGDLFSLIMPGWLVIDGWHFTSYLSFIMGIYFFYRLCRRLVDSGPAMAATLLFCTQPLILGHAFINPKDVPFMAFFLTSISLGLDMVDRFKVSEDTEKPRQPGRNWFSPIVDWVVGSWRNIANQWKSAAAKKKVALVIVMSIMVIGFIVINPVRSMLVEAFEDAYNNRPGAWMSPIFSLIANRGNLSPASYYTAKLAELSAHAFVGIEGFLLLVAFLLARTVFPLTMDYVVVAGCVLGLCSDIRTLGPASGALVTIYFLVRYGQKAISTLVKYFISAGVTIYIFWPYLWSNPIGNYLASLSEAQKFPWDGLIGFQGTQYTNANLPLRFLPTVMTIQFTETAMLLFAIGIGVALFSAFRMKERRMDVALLLVWFFAPPTAAILGKSIIYNNFRQFLFVIPPLFVLAALAFQQLWIWFGQRRVLFSLAAIVAILPGLYWNFNLFPYEYIYYNSLAGGVSGAFRQYETDYWCIAYKEAMEYVNEVAPQNATVAVYGSLENAQTYARKDLNMVILRDDLLDNVDYAILGSKWSHDLTDYTKAPVIYEVTRDEAILVVVKSTNGFTR